MLVLYEVNEIWSLYLCRMFMAEVGMKESKQKGKE